MEGTKIKNLVIIALIFINVFFLIVVLSDHITDRVVYRQEMRDIQSLMEQNGIEIDINEISNDTELIQYHTQRMNDKEAEIAYIFLGETTIEDKGGNIYKYSGESGFATFRSSGEFEIELNNSGIYLDNNVNTMVKRLSKDLGVVAENFQILNENENILITVTCSSAGKLVFNCQISYVFTDDHLVKIVGRRFDYIEQDQVNTEILTAATALMRFLTYVDEVDYACSKIVSIQVGYFMSGIVPGEGKLTPIWLISTDNDNFFVNAVTGDVEISTY